jgi:hypothetical protein
VSLLKRVHYAVFKSGRHRYHQKLKSRMWTSLLRPIDVDALALICAQVITRKAAPSDVDYPTRDIKNNTCVLCNVADFWQ